MNKLIIIALLSLVLLNGCKISESEGSKDCVDDDDCVVFGETGECNCGCYNKDNLPSGSGGKCFCSAPIDCKCVNNKCEGIFEEINSFEECAKNGELLREPDEYCCEGLKEWPIPDTRFSIADICYEVGQPSKVQMGMCIKCGDGVCGKHSMYDENPCNCPEDCKGKNKSMFQSIEEFCQSNDWKISISRACEEEAIKDSLICKLC